MIQTDACPMKKFPPICLAQTILNFIPVRAWLVILTVLHTDHCIWPEMYFITQRKVRSHPTKNERWIRNAGAWGSFRFNDTIDYTDYDSDGDGYIDALCLSVPSRGNADFWYGCTASWWASTLPDLDGEKLRKLSDHTAHWCFQLFFRIHDPWLYHPEW